jgi:hypothetical protein
LGSVTGALWRPDGRHFDGSDDYIQVPDATSLRCPDAVTIESWVYPLSITGEQTVGCKGAMGSGAGYAVTHSINNDGKVRFIIAWGTWPSEYTLDSARALSQDAWNHLVCSFDGTKMRIFINALQDPNTATPSSSSAGTNNFNIGTNPGAGGSWFEGRMGELRIYCRALTHQEVQRNYLATKWRYR